MIEEVAKKAKCVPHLRSIAMTLAHRQETKVPARAASSSPLAPLLQKLKFKR
jgi:hypothetical protein